jgi:hypothetical protein
MLTWRNTLSVAPVAHKAISVNRQPLVASFLPSHYILRATCQKSHLLTMSANGQMDMNLESEGSGSFELTVAVHAINPKRTSQVSHAQVAARALAKEVKTNRLFEHFRGCKSLPKPNLETSTIWACILNTEHRHSVFRTGVCVRLAATAGERRGDGRYHH